MWYASYTESTINYICNYLRRFHETNSVFLRFQAPKAARAKAEVVEQELKKQREARQRCEEAAILSIKTNSAM